MLIFGPPIEANLNPSQPHKLQKLQEDLKQQEVVIGKLQVQLGQLENTLGKHHQQFLHAQNVQKELELQLLKITKEQKTLGKLIMQQQQEGKKLLQGLLLQKLYQRPDQNVLMMQQMLILSLQKEQEKLIQLDKDHHQNQQVLEVVQRNWKNWRLREQSLLGAIEKLEKSREAAISATLNAESQRHRLQVNKDLLFAQQHQKRQGTPSLDFSSKFAFPISGHLKMEHQKKGLNFEFQGKMPVIASQNGRVIFQGSLSTYGKVVMIDHGNQMRSVLLGDFGPSVAKGDTVQKGDIIGYTVNLENRPGKIYFEIRNNEKIEDTILLMEKYL